MAAYSVFVFLLKVAPSPWQNKTSHSITDPLRPFAVACRLVFHVHQTCTHPLFEGRVKGDSSGQQLFSLSLCLSCFMYICNHKHVTQGVIMGLFITKWPQNILLNVSWLSVELLLAPSIDNCNCPQSNTWVQLPCFYTFYCLPTLKFELSLLRTLPAT